MPVARHRLNGVLIMLACVAVIAALLAATLGAGVSGLGLRELISGPGLPAPSSARAGAPDRVPAGPPGAHGSRGPVRP